MVRSVCSCSILWLIYLKLETLLAQNTSTSGRFSLSVSPASSILNGHLHLDNSTVAPSYRCVLQIPSQQYNNILHVGYSIDNSSKTICALNSSQNACNLNRSQDLSERITKLTWGTTPIELVLGEHNTTCIASLNTSDGSEYLHSTGHVRFFHVPEILRISIQPPAESLDSLIVQSNIYYNFSCQVEGGFPPSTVRQRLILHNKVLREAVGTNSSASFRFLLKRTHKKAYVECTDLTHYSEAEQLTTTTDKISGFVFIERNDRKVDTVKVYKDVGSTTLRCSDYITWVGDVRYYWFGRYGASPPVAFHTSHDDTYFIRYQQPEPDGNPFVICSATLRTNAAPQSITIPFRIEYYLESPWKKPTAAVGASLAGIALLIATYVVVKRVIRRRNVVRDEWRSRCGCGGTHSSSMLESNVQGHRKTAVLSNPFGNEPNEHIPMAELPTRSGTGSGIERGVSHPPYHRAGKEEKRNTSRAKSKIFEDFRKLSNVLSDFNMHEKRPSPNSATASGRNKTNTTSHQIKRSKSLDQLMREERPKFMDMVRASDKANARSRWENVSRASSLDEISTTQRGINRNSSEKGNPIQSSEMAKKSLAFSQWLNMTDSWLLSND